MVPKLKSTKWEGEDEDDDVKVFNSSKPFNRFYVGSQFLK